MSSDGESGLNSNRRQVLRLLGGGTAGVYVGSRLVQARGHGGNRGGRGVGPCTCEECPYGTFCGKVEGQPSEGDTYEFSSNGDAYSVTVERTETNEDGEITCFEFSSDDDIETVCVKGGPDTATHTDPEGDLLCAPTNPGGQDSEISNFSFCGTAGCESVCYQVDLVWWRDGYPIADLDSEQYGSDHLIEAYHDDICNGEGPATLRYSSESPTSDDCTAGDVDWSVSDGEVTASFVLDCSGDREEIGLVSYEDDCEYDELTDMDLANQRLVDSDHATFGDDGSLTVDLPL